MRPANRAGRGRMRFRRDKGEHVVEVELGLLTSRETVWVDGAVVYDEFSMRLFNAIPVVVGGKSGRVEVSVGWNLMPRVKLFVDGEPSEPWPKDRPLPGADAQLPALPQPRWAWFFVIACGILPALTGGGALPAAHGVGGAAACLTIAKKNDWRTTTPLVACSGVTTGCWAVVGALVWLLRR